MPRSPAHPPRPRLPRPLRPPLLPALALASVVAWCTPAHAAQALHWAGAGEVRTFDPHAAGQAPTASVLAHAYEALTRYDADYRLEPALATGWTRSTPTQWRFALRPDVRFHDGQPFTSADVVFSIERQRDAGGSPGASLGAIRAVHAVDERTVDIELERPVPLLPRLLAEVRIVSADWMRAHDARQAQDLKSGDENYASRHVNGTGPYRIADWQGDGQVRLRRNDAWWDTAAVPGLVAEAVYTAIPPVESRIAAMTAGDLDLATDLPPAGIDEARRLRGVQVLAGVEARTLFLGMDQSSAELKYGSEGPNPFRDARVRRALSLALDRDALRRHTMHGLSRAAGTIVSPAVAGWTAALDAVEPRDVAQARRLLTEAGHPDGVSVTLDCPNNRYLFDAALCAALVEQWREAGIRATLNTMPFASYIPKLEMHDTSLYLLGWSPTALDAGSTLQAVAHTVGPGTEGSYNVGRVSDTKLDALIDDSRTDGDETRRLALLQDALRLVREQTYLVPLHHAMRYWLARPGVRAAFRVDDRVDLRFVTVDAPEAGRPATAAPAAAAATGASGRAGAPATAATAPAAGSSAPAPAAAAAAGGTTTPATPTPPPPATAPAPAGRNRSPAR